MTRREFIVGAVTAAGASMAGCASWRGREEAWRMKAIRYANSTLAESWVFPDGRKAVKVPISFVMFYIEDGARRIMVDPGCDTMPGFMMENYVLPLDALAREGITPEQITDVVISHAHHDHIDCARHFPKSVIHIQRGEAERGRGYLSANTDVRVFDEAVQVSEHVAVRRIGGHTEGSSIVVLTGRAREYVICCDECYSRDNLTRRVRTAASANPSASQRFVDEYSSLKYKTFLCHDPTLFTGWIEGKDRPGATRPSRQK